MANINTLQGIDSQFDGPLSPIAADTSTTNDEKPQIVSSEDLGEVMKWMFDEKYQRDISNDENPQSSSNKEDPQSLSDDEESQSNPNDENASSASSISTNVYLHQQQEERAKWGSPILSDSNSSSEEKEGSKGQNCSPTVSESSGEVLDDGPPSCQGSKAEFYSVLVYYCEEFRDDEDLTEVFASGYVNYHSDESRVGFAKNSHDSLREERFGVKEEEIEGRFGVKPEESIAYFYLEFTPKSW